MLTKHSCNIAGSNKTALHTFLTLTTKNSSISININISNNYNRRNTKNNKNIQQNQRELKAFTLDEDVAATITNNYNKSNNISTARSNSNNNNKNNSSNSNNKKKRNRWIFSTTSFKSIKKEKKEITTIYTRWQRNFLCKRKFSENFYMKGNLVKIFKKRKFCKIFFKKRK